ncbi:unnamed protein product [Bemisia tabaci]|uniref:Lipoma HMGIC fusion partner-like protein n=1 Tax=Bemisia tabaci TaxID=7038 RepID=A0A9P0AD38_BEMTA|nr:PREDICTED: lipoma HMGIC fusion partner-like [Bemisia tabaci]CAH0388025.1 unnamed protein product [Bemisia tabaci]
MPGSLSAVGTIWSMFSLTAAVLCCCGFYLPFWIQGRLLERADAYFSSFRRCNYPRLTARGDIEIVMECGRYSRFEDIPSVWWQVTTIVMCLGCALSVLASVTALSACCFSYVLHSTSAKTTGGIQLLAALLMTSGAALYPLGWDNRQVRESCGHLSSAYKLGTCQLSWSAYIICSAIAMLLLCALLSICAAKNS